MREVGYHNLVPKTAPFISSQFCRWEGQVGPTGLYARILQAQCQGVARMGLIQKLWGRTCFWAHSGVGKFSPCSGRIEGLGLC